MPVYRDDARISTSSRPISVVPHRLKTPPPSYDESQTAHSTVFNPTFGSTNRHPSNPNVHTDGAEYGADDPLLRRQSGQVRINHGGGDMGDLRRASYPLTVSDDRHSALTAPTVSVTAPGASDRTTVMDASAAAASFCGQYWCPRLASTLATGYGCYRFGNTVRSEFQESANSCWSRYNHLDRPSAVAHTAMAMIGRGAASVCALSGDDVGDTVRDWGPSTLGAVSAATALHFGASIPTTLLSFAVTKGLAQSNTIRSAVASRLE